MRALRSFTIRAHLPAPLAPLRELATNLRWSWDERTRDLFRWVEPELWAASGDPVRVLDSVGPERLESLAADPAFMAFMEEVHADLRRELQASLWFQGRQGSELRSVAYFSPEFGITEALPQYSGGLGVLAGDHLKAASNLGVPLIGVGLLYRHGYFRQRLAGDGWQTERYPELDPHAMALTGPQESTISLGLDGHTLVARVWRANVGRVRLYLLDSDVEENEPDLRAVTDRLYGGGTEHRLAQEVLLGMGGVRALEALGEDVQVFHTNEGHAGFQGLERVRTLVTKAGLRFEEAVETVRASTIFTTHTPVPAGIDRFPAELLRRYFSTWAEDCGIPFSALMELGHLPGEADEAPFNMAVMGLRLSGAANAVSKLHGQVSREMFAPLWPDLEPSEIPITSVTNGVHARTWTSPEMDDLLTRAVLPSWHEAGPDDWARVDQLRDDQLWRAKEQGRERLVAMVRQRLRSALAEAGVPEPELAWCDEVLDPRILTIGFARRFATYKRAALLLSQPERLRALLLSTDRPIQLVFAGKAHPADDLGKELIRSLVTFSRDPEVRHRIAFVEDYDIAVARTLYQGADIWLNHPRRPMEACGTSGMKAALSGALNCSVRDGWWDECYDGDNGWAIASAAGEADEAKRDAVEASSLFALLEREIIPLFYERYGGPVPRGWVRRIRSSLRSLGPQVVASRMVREYTAGLYEPAARRSRELSHGEFARARALARWKHEVRGAWPKVRVEPVASGHRGDELGTRRRVEVTVDLGTLSPADVSVQLLHGPVGANEELQPAGTVSMSPAQPGSLGPIVRYAGAFDCSRTGRYGFAVRALPAHPDLSSPLELGLATWA